MGERKNIFLDFLSPDNWKTYITLSGTYPVDLLSTICQSLNIAVFLTNEHCLIPPGFLLQSRIVLNAMKKKSLFLEERLIYFPLKENALEHYFYKKEDEYSLVKQSHSGIYDTKRKKFIEKNRNIIIQRKASMGMSIAEKWQKIPDNSPIWLPIINTQPRLVDKIRISPHELKNRNQSVTLEGLKNILKIENNQFDFHINQAIQHEYLLTYMQEYGCEIIKNIPPKPMGVNYLVGSDNSFYDYCFIKQILSLFGIFELIKNADPQTIIKIRQTSEYVRFMDILYNACSLYNKNDVLNWFSGIKLHILNEKKLFLATVNRCRQLKDILYIIVDSYSKISGITNGGFYTMAGSDKKTKVFIVHGHDNEAKLETARFLEHLGLTAIILHEQQDGGMTIMEKLEKNTDVDFAIILYTPCDEGKAKNEATYRNRARQNVVFEHGYLIGKLGRKNVCALIKDDVEPPGDFSGVIYKKMDSPGAWKLEVAKEIKAAGYDVDLNML